MRLKHWLCKCSWFLVFHFDIFQVQKEKFEGYKENKNYFEMFKDFLVHINDIHLLPYVRKDKEPDSTKRLLNEFNKF